MTNEKLNIADYKIDVLDKGYVRLVDVLGDDATVANAARISYDKSIPELGPKDERLLAFLAREGHTSPFRHTTLQFEVYAPLMIARQWFKYLVGGNIIQDAWNESSRRYITENEEFYVPQSDEWRTKPENSKQGSGPNMPPGKGGLWTDQLLHHQDQCVALYRQAMDAGVAPEQARLFLPANGMYIRFYWTASLQSVSHLINQRVESDAQFEFQEYAKAVRELALKKFPVSLSMLIK